MTKFEKGWKGGPGRPKLTQEEKDIRKMALEHAEDVVATLIMWVKQGVEPAASVAACKELLNRAFGMSTQHSVSEVNVTYTGARERLGRKLHAVVESKPEERASILTH